MLHFNESFCVDPCRYTFSVQRNNKGTNSWIFNEYNSSKGNKTHLLTIINFFKKEVYPNPVNNKVSSVPLLFVRFDQLIDPEEVLKCVSFTSGSLIKKNLGGARLLTSEEIKSNEYVHKQATEYEGYMLCFTSAKPLPNDSKVHVTVGPQVANFLLLCETKCCRFLQQKDHWKVQNTKCKWHFTRYQHSQSIHSIHQRRMSSMLDKPWPSTSIFLLINENSRKIWFV